MTIETDGLKGDGPAIFTVVVCTTAFASSGQSGRSP